MASKFKDTRSVKLENVMAKDFIPLFSGRPKRDWVIGRDDLVDLDILLHTANTVEDFIAKA